ncbi:PAS domain S-box protein [candidate division TA06 bacterium]|uniref:histidine kinase n=1 Tax=candidate division TA06 bacterium TaxID=2250710 RepID=A0A933IAQ8_UNCT6|nr:PAS domain S-box protein [candidate division TA06 bacterium]
MKDREKTREQLLAELGELRARIGKLAGIEREHARVEAALQESEATFRALAETSPSGIFVYREKFLYVNSACLAVTGYGREEFRAMRFWDMVHPEFRDLVRDRGLARQRGEPVPAHYEFKITRKDGVDRWLDFAGAQIQFQGEAAGLGIVYDITERKQAEAALKASEEQYRLLVESQDEGLAIVDGHERFLFVNPAGCRIFAVPDGSLNGRCLSEFADAANFRMIAQQTKLRQDGGSNEYEIEIIRGDKVKRIIKVSAKPQYGQSGQFDAAFGVFQDITERRLAEIRLKESEEIYHTLVNSSPDAVTMTDLQGRMIFVSEQTLKLHGYSHQDELLGQPAFMLIAAQDHQRAGANMEITLNQGSIRDIEYIFLKKDGSSFIGELNASLIRNVQGLPKAFIATTRDVTEHRNAEELVRKSEERYRRLLEAVTDYTYTVQIRDGKHAATQHSPNCLAVTGYSAEEYDADPNLWLNMVYQQDKQLVMEQAARLWAGEAVPPLEHRIIHKNGTFRWVKNTVVPRFDEQGKLMAYDGLVSGITERKLAEEEVKKLNLALQHYVTQLEDVNRELEAFNYSVSHGLRTPLVSIGGFSNLLLKEHSGGITSDCKQYLNVIRNNAVKMEKLIDDLLNRSYLGWKPIMETEIDINELVSDILGELESSFNGRNIQYNVGSLPNVRADRVMIHQVFTNYLTNAIKYTSIRDQAIIEIGGRSEAKGNIYYVRDNGVGFDMKLVDKLFSVFQRLHDQHEFKGTGVGLSIAQRIIHRHGGRVWAESEINKGSTFYFSLPREEPKEM